MSTFTFRIERKRPLEEDVASNKKRIINSCLPCRRRKVRCDQSRPCLNCVRRNERCSAADEPEPASAMSGKSPASSESGIPTKAISSTSGAGQPGGSQPVDGAVHPLIEQNVDGSLSLPLLDDDDDDDNDAGTKPPLALASHLANADVLAFFESFQQHSHPWTPLVHDIGRIETWVVELAISNTRTWKDFGSHTQRGLLYAVLALGAQYSGAAAERRALMVRTLVTLAFKMLKRAHYLQRPTLDAVEALLVLGHVVQNVRSCEGSWALLGMTIRLAQICGIGADHVTWSSAAEERQVRSLRQSLAWQDRLMSLCLLREPSYKAAEPAAPCQPGVGYRDAMLAFLQRVAFLQCTYDGLPGRTLVWDGWLTKIRAFRDEFEPVAQSIGAGNGGSGTTNVLSTLQSVVLRLHVAYASSFLCRNATQAFPERDPTREGPRRELLALRRAGLVEAAQLYLTLLPLSAAQSARTWTVAHNGFGAILMLGQLGELRRDRAAFDLAARCLADLRRYDADDSTIVPPKSRARRWLQKLYDDAAPAHSGPGGGGGGGAGAGPTAAAARPLAAPAALLQSSTPQTPPSMPPSLPPLLPPLSSPQQPQAMPHAAGDPVPAAPKLPFSLSPGLGDILPVDWENLEDLSSPGVLSTLFDDLDQSAWLTNGLSYS